MNKNGFNLKLKSKSIAIALVTLFLLSTLAGTQLIGNVSAAIPYTEYTGTLDGADWALRIPDPWNGMLVVACRPAGAFLQNPATILDIMGGSMLDAGFAVAASNFGEAPEVPVGVDSTYQLTMHVIDNYGVTGKIFLYGISLGGPVAMLLGEKYPEIYSGVLDVAGVKDLKAGFYRAEKIAAMTDEELEAELTALGSQIPPYLYSSLDAFRDAMAEKVARNIDLYGGPPDTHPQGYEDFSPTYHAEIDIPAIAVHGTADANIPYSQALLLENAVAKAYRSDLYRLYAVQGGQHASMDVLAEANARFNELVEWSNELTGAHDWSMYRGNLQHTGVSSSNAPTTNYTLWVTDVGAYSQSSPAVVDGKLYVGTGSNVTCLDAATGAKIWNYTTGGFIFSSPAVVNDRVYIGSYDFVFYCLDAATGAKIWSYTTGDQIGSSPAVANGKVYFGSADGNLYCLRADWGQIEWVFTVGDGVSSSPAIAYGNVYVGAADGKFRCINAASGTLVWSYTTGDAIPATAAVVDGRVFIGSTDDTAYCLDADTGAKIWSYAMGGDAHNPAVVNGKVYVGSSDNNMYCLDAATGAKIWNFTAGGDVISPAAVADGKVYTGSWDSNVYCLDAETGALIWSYKTGSTAMFYQAPAIANGVVYIACFDQMVYAFSAWAPIPEGLTLSIMLLLSTIAVIVSIRYYRKRPKWQNW